MFEISSKTGIHHLVGGAVPDNSAALRMLRGTELPEALCGMKIQPVNFYEHPAEQRPQFQCSKCFRKCTRAEETR